jgi:hypothetical protein
MLWMAQTQAKRRSLDHLCSGVASTGCGNRGTECQHQHHGAQCLYADHWLRLSITQTYLIPGKPAVAMYVRILLMT